jgi:hypothetical protein
MPTSRPFRFCVKDAFEVKTSQSKCEAICPPDAARYFAEYRPCFRFARRHFSNPSGVFGPVLAPPCIRHRVYAHAFSLHIAGARQGAPERALALQRGEADGSPEGFPLRSLP